MIKLWLLKVCFVIFASLTYLIVTLEGKHAYCEFVVMVIRIRYTDITNYGYSELNSQVPRTSL